MGKGGRTQQCRTAMKVDGSTSSGPDITRPLAWEHPKGWQLVDPEQPLNPIQQKQLDKVARFNPRCQLTVLPWARPDGARRFSLSAKDSLEPARVGFVLSGGRLEW